VSFFDELPKLARSALEARRQRAASRDVTLPLETAEPPKRRRRLARNWRAPREPASQLVTAAIDLKIDAMTDATDRLCVLIDETPRSSATKSASQSP
jgi:hypothetical protein